MININNNNWKYKVKGDTCECDVYSQWDQCDMQSTDQCSSLLEATKQDHWDVPNSATNIILYKFKVVFLNKQFEIFNKYNQKKK